MVFKRLSPTVQKIVKKRGFAKPTAPQKLGIEPILAGKNILMLAKTGTGKTESAILPIFDMWLKEKPSPISILYITPLKSLNRDMLKRLLWWGNELEMDISVRHGDTSQYARKMQAEVPPDCLITTPETLQAILPGKRMKEHLRSVKWVIVDEVHELVSSKRGTQLAIGLERLRELCGNFQLISLSATVGSPEYVAKFISGGRQMEIIKTETEKGIDIKVINPKTTAADDRISEQAFTKRETAARLRTVHDLINSHVSTLTFTNTRDFAEVLTSRLKMIYPMFSVENHHSSLSKVVRIKTEDDFKSQKLKSVVCTSSLELGIDVGAIDFVLQYMSPRQVSRIVQRVGRSGHEQHRTSDGVIITTDIDDIFESAVIARRALAGELEPIKSHENALDVLAHQIVGILRDNYQVEIERIYQILRRAYPYHGLTRKRLMSVCQLMSANRYLFINEDNIKSSRKGLLYYFENLSTIPDTKNYLIINMITNEKVGVLDEEFVALHGAAGSTFIIKGEPWVIISIDGRRIFVEPSDSIEAAIPGWEGDLLPIPFDVAQEVGSLRENVRKKLEEKMRRADIEKDVKSEYPVDDSCAKKIVSLVARQKKYGIVPNDKKILIENYGDALVIHGCFGSKVNETLGRFLSTALATRIGSVGMKSGPYRIILQLQIMDKNLINETLFKTKPEILESFLELNLSNSKLFQWKFIHVAKRFGVIRKGAEYGRVALSKIIDVYSGTPVWLETLREIGVEKLDVQKAKEILKKIQSGEIEVVFKEGVSPIAKIKLSKQRPELIGSGKSDIQVLELFEKRLMEKRVRLICLNCGDWTRTYHVRDVPKEIRCGKCRARLIGYTRPTQIEHQKLVKKKLNKKPMMMDEERKLKNLEKTSDLIIVYGKRAVMALAVRGIGPRTAARILGRMFITKKDFMKTLLNAERTYIKNKRFWS